MRKLGNQKTIIDNEAAPQYPKQYDSEKYEVQNFTPKKYIFKRSKGL